MPAGGLPSPPLSPPPTSFSSPLPPCSCMQSHPWNHGELLLKFQRILIYRYFSRLAVLSGSHDSTRLLTQSRKRKVDCRPWPYYPLVQELFLDLLIKIVESRQVTFERCSAKLKYSTNFIQPHGFLLLTGLYSKVLLKKKIKKFIIGLKVLTEWSSLWSTNLCRLCEMDSFVSDTH